MKFSHILFSHLTPEWRAHYIDYKALKVLVYKMVSQDWTKKEKDEDDLTELIHPVDEDKQTEFFDEIQRQLDGVNSFYRVHESELSHQLQHLAEQVDTFSQFRRIKNSNRKRNSLIKAFCEFYYHLSLLQNFQKLNHTGFRKILKKHDKLACSDRGSKFFKENVEKSYFHKSKEINALVQRTEDIMINQLENGNRGRAMAKLRVPPLGGVSSPWAILASGWLMGAIFIMAVVAVIACVYRNRSPLPWSPDTGVLLGLRSGFVLSVWFFSFAVNTYFWRYFGINNVLIFEFDPRNHLNFQQLFAVASFMGIIWSSGLLLFLFADWLHIPYYVGPVSTWVVWLILFSLPVPFLYWRSRWWLLKEIVRILFPYYDVSFPDFWIADQLNSLAIVLLDMQYFICYLVYGQNATTESLAKCGIIYYTVRPFVAMLPAWWRFAQCVRRYGSTREAFPHLVNAGKYSTAFFVVTFSTVAAALKDKDAPIQSDLHYFFLACWIISALISSCYTYAWDIKMDWGLFERGYFTRRERIYPYTASYIVAMIEDLLLRWVWTLTISVGEGGLGVLNDNIFKTVLSVLEVFRRFIWNFLRLENEHLNNCGQFRAVRDISIRPITANEIEGVDPEEKGPLRTLKRRASEILGISDQHPSVTAARRQSSGELGRRLSISGATRLVSVSNQDQSTSVTSVNPSTDILTTGSARKRRCTVGGLLVEVNELETITNGSVDEPVTGSDINVDLCSRSEGRESEGGGGGGHRSLQVGFVLPAVIPETIL